LVTMPPMPKSCAPPGHPFRDVASRQKTSDKISHRVVEVGLRDVAFGA
jgi:hypothetical protein